jgi:hypothetical protein
MTTPHPSFLLPKEFEGQYEMRSTMDQLSSQALEAIAKAQSRGLLLAEIRQPPGPPWILEYVFVPPGKPHVPSPEAIWRPTQA